MTETSAIPNNHSTVVLDASSEIEPDVVRLASTIDYHSPLSIQNFGAELAAQTSAYTDEILSNARTAELSETGEKLNQIVNAVQDFDLRQLDNPVVRTPIIGAILKRFVETKERSIARFESVRTQVEKIVSQVENTAATLNKRNHDYHAMYQSVLEEHAMLGQHVEAIELRLNDLEAEMALPRMLQGDPSSAEIVAVLETSRNQLSKRADDLRMLQHTAMQLLSMVRVIQSNNLLLVDKFQTIRLLTLPTWKRTFLLALTLDEQKSAVALATTIDDATNDLMKRNAELLRQNSVATAKANQRLVIDIDTLKQVHDTIIQTLSDVRDAHEEGAVERAQAMNELERLREEMSTAAKAIGARDD